MSESDHVIINRYRVSGMTCLHCARSVTEELSTIAGVTDVDVNLASGDVRVASTKALDTDEVVAAIAEAGYEVVT
jgi:copper chaperone CopZ